MTRFAWLQSRTQTLVVLGLLGALAVVAAITGVHLSHLFHSSVVGCVPGTGCGFAISRFLSHYSFMDRALDILARAVPALIGLFWGAPLIARELESGTHRLAWTQSVSRRRWLVAKLSVGALATVIVAGLLTVTITWWSTSRDQVGGANSYAVFDRRDIAPVAYALFAFTSGALVGAIIRRTVPAMATALGGFVFVRIAMSIWVRPHLMTPVHKALSLPTGPDSPGPVVRFGIGTSNGGQVHLFADGSGPPRSWTLSSHLVTSAGHKLSSGEISAFVHQQCPNVSAPPPGPGGIPDIASQENARACMSQVSKTFHLLITYQPANRYWTFQWLETAIFVALALAAAIGCYWWVTRRTN